MRRIYGDTCMICGWNYASCDTHHIFGQARGGSNELTNLIVLCPNHHRMADNDLIPVEDLIEARQKKNVP